MRRERNSFVMPVGKVFCVVCPILPLISGLYRNSIINVNLDHCDPERQKLPLECQPAAARQRNLD